MAPRAIRIPAAWGERFCILGSLPKRGRERQHMVNGSLSMSVAPTRKTRWLPPSLMDGLYISGRLALADASELIDRFGDDAGYEAAVRAETSRDAGNVVKFCHWRQIERVIANLANPDVRGIVH